MKAAFCRRRRGLEPVTFHHPRLERVLAGTHGLMLYEEDVLRVATALTPLTLAEGDDLRRAIGAARTDDEFMALERGLRRPGARAPASTRPPRARCGATSRASRPTRSARRTPPATARSDTTAPTSRRTSSDRVGGRDPRTTTPGCTPPGSTSRTCGGRVSSSTPRASSARRGTARSTSAIGARCGSGSAACSGSRSRPATGSRRRARRGRSRASPTSSTACARPFPSSRR